MNVGQLYINRQFVGVTCGLISMALLGIGCWAESARVETTKKEKRRVSVRMKNLLDL